MKMCYIQRFFLVLFISISISFAQTVTDIDGNVYNTVVIGSQTWLKENLRTSRFRNGDAIPKITSSQQWQNTITAAYTIYNNDTAIEAIYGKLYNWLAASDARGICPTGYKVPSDSDWTVLVNYLGGEMVAGGKMKESGFAHWSAPNTGADNSSGFTALPAGMRATNGDFYHLGELAGWWSTTVYDAYNSWMRDIFYNSAQINRSLGKYVGFSCRCIKEVTTSDKTENNFNPPLLHPNPAYNEVKLSGINQSSSNICIEVFSLTGELLIRTEKISEDNTIDISKLCEGLYFVKIVLNGQQFFTEKLLILR